ncbi:ATP-binding protein [Nonomuraea zeae]|nr:ATP-binding protein [Nonomuraea zeae]
MCIRSHRDPPARPLGAASWTLAHDFGSVPVARALLRSHLAGWSMDDATDDAELLVSELITNAVRHAPGPVRLTVWLVDGFLRCEVEDRHPAVPLLPDAPERDEGGYGLRLLDALACCWGSDVTPAGKAVWFELPATATHDHRIAHCCA